MPWPVSGARDCGLAMQAFSPQLRLLLGLTDKRCWAAPSSSPPRCARLYLFVFVFLTVLCKHSEEFHSDFFFFFFFWTSTRQQLAFAAVLLCFRNVLIRTLKAFKSPSVPTCKKTPHNDRYVGEVFSPGIYIYRQKYKGNVPMFTHLFVPWAGNENYWLKAFQLRSQIRERITGTIAFSRFFPLSAKVITVNGALIDWTNQRQKEPFLLWLS